MRLTIVPGAAGGTGYEREQTAVRRPGGRVVPGPDSQVPRRVVVPVAVVLPVSLRLHAVSSSRVRTERWYPGYSALTLV